MSNPYAMHIHSDLSLMSLVHTALIVELLQYLTTECVAIQRRHQAELI